MCIKRRITLILALMGLSMIAWAYTYDTATPAGTDDPRYADDHMREIKAAVQERMNNHNGTADEGDHYWPLSGTEVLNADAGQHRMITLRQMSGNPSALTSYSTRTDLGWLFQKDFSGNGELCWQDEATNVLQMTKGGDLFLGSGELVTTGDSVIRGSTSDAGDSGSLKAAAGGAAGVGRGATIELYGNEHATTADRGKIKLIAGYSTGTTKAIIDASSSVISNVGTPAAATDAATKGYVDGFEKAQVEGTSTITRNTASYADMTNMSISFTTKSGNVLLIFSAYVELDDQAIGLFKFVVDSTSYHEIKIEDDSTGFIKAPVFMQYLVTGLSAASHTFKVQWYANSKTVTQPGASYPRVFTAIEIP